MVAAPAFVRDLRLLRRPIGLGLLRLVLRPLDHTSEHGEDLGLELGAIGAHEVRAIRVVREVLVLAAGGHNVDDGAAQALRVRLVAGLEADERGQLALGGLVEEPLAGVAGLALGVHGVDAHDLVRHALDLGVVRGRADDERQRASDMVREVLLGLGELADPALVLGRERCLLLLRGGHGGGRSRVVVPHPAERGVVPHQVVDPLLGGPAGEHLGRADLEELGHGDVDAAVDEVEDPTPVDGEGLAAAGVLLARELELDAHVLDDIEQVETDRSEGHAVLVLADRLEGPEGQALDAHVVDLQVADPDIQQPREAEALDLGLLILLALLGFGLLGGGLEVAGGDALELGAGALGRDVVTLDLDLELLELRGELLVLLHVTLELLQDLAGDHTPVLLNLGDGLVGRDDELVELLDLHAQLIDLIGQLVTRALAAKLDAEQEVAGRRDDLPTIRLPGGGVGVDGGGTGQCGGLRHEPLLGQWDSWI